MRGERGQVAAEYMGVLALAAAAIFALTSVTAVPATIAGNVEAAVCRIAGGACDALAEAPAADPAAVAAAAARLGGLDDPEAVAALFAELDAVTANALARERPDLVGNTDGAPLALRLYANELRIAADPRFAHLLEGGRRFLLFDPSGDGRLAEVFGDLETARHVAVVVPGMNNDIGNFTGGDARRLQAAADALDPRQVATVQWLGYDTPEGATALGRGAARPGARALPDFLDGIRAQRDERLHVTVVGHSYGSLVAGLARLDEGLQTDELVFVGSPGVGAGSAAELGHGGELNVWVGAARNDVISGSGWHGPNPHGPLFGADRFHTGDISGHSSYFQEGSLSLLNLGRIVAGNLDEVERV
jgi:pimeloyl-ACP methyl ester carboxylesterase